MNKYTYLIYTLVTIIVIFTLNTCAPYDSTDNSTKNVRSGMKLYTDHLTGCQYLSTGILIGNLTPRLNTNGSPMCIRENYDR